ncbi:unnamed protein product [Dovyalis caffra]|uniref:Uncharacterized protein n=1 Tax=Dovyalis caffra TaxID=77055 RepID=A0AAV1SRZ8_9ROSI|nr:unnamed protein product [Dovyalis caffra]
MCLQNCGVEHLSVEEAVAADESLLIYCKPVELYNILGRRAQDNPSSGTGNFAWNAIQFDICSFGLAHVAAWTE